MYVIITLRSTLHTWGVINNYPSIVLIAANIVIIDNKLKFYTIYYES